MFFLTVFCAGFMYGNVLAQSDDLTSFGIRPTKSYEGKPETSSYFSYESSAGSVISDEATVLNDGSVPVILKLFAADGITAQNGGTSLVAPGDPGERQGVLVSNWISLPTDQVSLKPGEKVVIPFTITIPADVQPGQHIGGLMVESIPTGSEAVTNNSDQAQFTVNVVKRVGVAVVIDIPGEHTITLVVDKIGFEIQDENGATFAVKINNTGNMMTTAEGNFLITDTNQKVLTSLPIKVDTILPGDSTTVYLFEPLNLADGDYLMSVGLIYEGGTAILDGIELRLRRGIAVTGNADEISHESMSMTPAVISLNPAKNSMGEFWMTIQENPILAAGVLLSVILLIILMIGFLDWRKRKNRPEVRKK